MIYHLAGFGDNHVRHQMAVAMAMITLKAEQTASPFRGQCLCLRQCQPGFPGIHMSFENRHHSLRMAGTDSVAPRFRRTKTS
jgi:hypothetical protein